MSKERRGPSTVIIHKTGCVSYFSATRRVLTTTLPENIPTTDLNGMSANDQDRLRARFGRKRTGSGWHLMSAQEKREAR